LCPLGAALFQDHRRTRYWFGAYLGCVVLLIVLDPMLRVHALPLSATLSAAVLAMNILGLTVVAFLGLQFFVQQLDREYSRSESLLDNVLPRSIAARLKGGESTIADGFDSVSILFADLVGFTRASTLMKPEIMVAYLNDAFSVFDRLVEKRGLEKIKPIGDAYMVVGGLGQGPQDVVPVIADLAMDMHRAMKTMQGPVDLQLRIGIHTGAAVAGVIGVKRFAYDVRGDTVNTASRMESHGLPGETQISEQTRAALGEHFEVQERGPVEIKGKGSMCTYWLRGRRRRSLLDLARRSVLSETGPQDTGSRPN